MKEASPNNQQNSVGRGISALQALSGLIAAICAVFTLYFLVIDRQAEKESEPLNDFCAKACSSSC